MKKPVIFFMLLLTSACSPAAHVPTTTPSPTSMPTTKPIPTSTVQPTPSAIWVTLGSPFASDCGDGIPVVWSNDSFNGPFRVDRIGPHWGHVDFMVPKECDVNTFTREVIAPVTGFLSTYDYGDPTSIGYKIELPSGVYLNGIVEAFEFSGINEFQLSDISKIQIDIGHLDPVNAKTGNVTIGDSIGDIIPYRGHQKIGYHIFIFYKGIEYAFSPTLFPNILGDGTILLPMIDNTSTNWTCAQDSYVKHYANSNEDCIPEKHDYAP